MNQLTIRNKNGKFVANSLEVAEMTGKLHKHLLRDIDSYMRILTESNFGPSDFFIESSYQDSTGRTLRSYDLTRKGCDMVANKMTGEKGVLFTAAYVTKFEEMEKQITPGYQLPQTMPEALRLLAAEMEEKQRVVNENEKLSLQSAEQQKKLKEQETPVAIYHLAISAHNTMSMQEVAKSLNTGRTRLYQILRTEGVIMKGSTMPYQRFLDAGYFKVTERPRASGDTIVNDPATRVTAKGFDFIARLMKKRNERISEGLEQEA
ncbi:Rha family transcriptional regulator [Paenibacillus rhizolycopersici]|uniref:Rha family transcriptional regulator n=1 Tax=Paenibacillus rhizolycopersici TaxID=2780073 RepID=UPI003D26D917